MSTVIDTERDGFMERIVAEPDEDTHRLVFADWLQENGDEARADFIRVQCELTKELTDISERHHNNLDMILDPNDSEKQRRKHRVWELQKRESALLTANLERWRRVPCPECIKGYEKHPTRSDEVIEQWCRTCDRTGDIGGLTWKGIPQFEPVFRRGFPVEVQRCRLQDVFHQADRDCPRCDGTGEERIANAAGDMDDEQCRICHGHTRVRGAWLPTLWATRVLAHHPTIHRIPLTDCSPYKTAAGFYRWWREDPSVVPSCSLPGPIYDAVHLSLKEKAEWPRTAEAANDALATAVPKAVVDWIKKNPRPPQE